MIRRTLKVVTRTRVPRPFPDLSSIGSKSMKMKLSHWMAQHRLSRGLAWFLFSTILLTGTTYAYLTDIGIHVPPMTGPYAYNAFMPGTPGFPAVGGTYTDPVFGTVVRRLTNQTGHANCDDIYAHHWANANGTFAFAARVVGAFCQGPQIVNVATGVEVFSNQPSGLNASENYWDALDPDKYYYFSGANLVRRNLALQTDTIKKTFPATLEANGGSLNIQSRDGRYFTVRYGGTNKVWDSQTDTIYSGSVTPLDLGGWVSITPDAKYMVTAAGPSASPNIEHYSYPIDHSTQSIGSTPTQFWGLCGDHGALVSASNGKNYFVTFNCNNISAVYAVDITLNQAGATPAQQSAANRLLVPHTWNDAGHISAVSKGAFADWVFISTESTIDTFDSLTAGWTAYEQEILAVNVVTLEIRRLAQHRSRGVLVNYSNFPRVSSAWDGSVVMWASNFNIGSPTGYADLYAIQFPLAGSPPPSGPPPAPGNLRVN